MVPSSAGAVVMVSFPFSDLSQTKLRPAAVLAGAGRGDFAGSSQVVSYARPGKLFTANESHIASEVGTLKNDAFERVREAVVTLLRPKRAGT